METKVSSFNAENQMDGAEEKIDKSTTTGQIEEETKVVLLEEYFAKDAEEENYAKQNEEEEVQVQKAKEIKEGTCQINLLVD